MRKVVGYSPASRPAAGEYRHVALALQPDELGARPVEGGLADAGHGRLLLPSPRRRREAERFRADALSIERLINDNTLIPSGSRAASCRCRHGARGGGTSRRSPGAALIRGARPAPADHHAITGASCATGAVVPSYADSGSSRAAALRDRGGTRRLAGPNSPAFAPATGCRSTGSRRPRRCRLLGRSRPGADARSAGFAAGSSPPAAATVPRRLTVQAGGPRVFRPAQPLRRRTGRAGRRSRRGRAATPSSSGSTTRWETRRTVAAFDAAMARARRGQRVVIDLTDTPSGGNTNVARAKLGWFVGRPTATRSTAFPPSNGEPESPGNGSSRCCRGRASAIAARSKCAWAGGPGAWRGPRHRLDASARAVGHAHGRPARRDLRPPPGK